MTKKIYAFFALLMLTAGFAEPGFSQRKKVSARKNAVSAEPRWNKAELGLGSPVKIALDTTSLPKEFGGHDFVELYANLEKAVKRLPKDAPPERRRELLENVKLLGSLTIDDYFIFKVQLNSSVDGVSIDSTKAFKAETFQLRQQKRIEADLDMFDGCYGVAASGALPRGDSPEDFIKSFKDDAVWEKSYLLLNTVKPIYNKKSYRGKVEEDSPGDDCRFRYVVPNPQAQYELAFTKPQAFELAESKTVNLSLKNYEYRDQKGIGVIAWHARGEKESIADGDWLTTLFVVRITAPFLSGEVLETDDLIEKKKFKMFSRTIYVDIENIWAVSWKTGKVVKKISGTR